MDVKIHWRLVCGVFAYMALLPWLGPIIGMHGKEAIMGSVLLFGAVAIPVLLPWWTVGNDRMKGTIWFVVALPMLRSEIVAVKAAETILGSLLFAVSGLVGLWAAHIVTPQEAMIAFAYASLVIVPLGLIATSLYFVLPSRAVMLVLYGIFFGAARFAKPLVVMIGSLPFWSGYYLALCAGLSVGLATLAIAHRIWEGRASPAEA